MFCFLNFFSDGQATAIVETNLPLLWNCAEWFQILTLFSQNAHNKTVRSVSVFRGPDYYLCCTAIARSGGKKSAGTPEGWNCILGAGMSVSDNMGEVPVHEEKVRVRCRLKYKSSGQL